MTQRKAICKSQCFIYPEEDKMNCLPTYCFQNSVYKEKEDKLMILFTVFLFLLCYSIYNIYTYIDFLNSKGKYVFSPIFQKGLSILCSASEGFYVEILTVFSVFSKTSRASSKLHFSSLHSLSRFPGINSSSLPELYLFGRWRILVAFSRSRKTEI